MIEQAVSKFGAESAESASGLGALGLDFKAFIIQLITFLLVFYVLKRFVFSRVVDLLEKRRKTIEEGVSLTGELQLQKEKLEQEIAAAHKKAREDAEVVIASAQEHSAEIIKRGEESAEEKSEKILAEARQKIVDETLKAKRDLEKEMTELIISATEKVTREKLNTKKDQELINSLLKELA